jgi:hypothetical protein
VISDRQDVTVHRRRTFGFAVSMGVALLVAAGCAKKLPPPGGKIDTEPPRILKVTPDSGAVNVPRTGGITVTFDEGMSHAGAASWILIGPYARARKLEWTKNSLTYWIADSLRANQTYSLVVTGAADARGNRLANPFVTHFATGAQFPPGRITGRIVGRGHLGEGVFLWAYRDDLGHAPDSTARDFDALTIGGDGGDFALLGLPIPSTWKLFAFHDANRTLTFEPGTDQLTPYPSRVTLTAANPAVDSLAVASIDPTAPAVVYGTVVDSLAPGVPIRILVEKIEAAPESARVAPKGPAPRPPSPSDYGLENGQIRLSLQPGRYRLRVYLDLNHDNRRDERTEPASDPLEIEVTAGQELKDLRLVAPPAPALPQPEAPR